MSMPLRPDDQRDDTDRDAWLAEALRHAPDAQAAPPAALSEAILRQARVAARPAGAALPTRSPWATAWAWLARPPVAAGFASVMVATLVGLVWWDQPIAPTLARAPAIGAPPPPTVAAPPPAAAVPAPAPAPALEKPARDAAKSEAEPAAQRKLAAPKPMQPTIEQAPARSAVSAPERERLAQLADRRTATDAAAPAARRSEALAEVRPAAFVTLLASIAAQPERWGWERSGAVQPMTPALQRWLAQLDAATATTRWRAAAEAKANPDAESSGEAAALRLYRDGTLAATLRLDNAAVGLVPGPRAALPSATLGALKQALDDATR